MAFSPETFALLMGKIKGLASGISSVVVGSNKQSLVFTTTNGTTVTVSIPNPINTVELCNKLSIDASNHLLYDGKRIAEYTEIPTATSQLNNDSGFITSNDLPTIPSKVSELTNDSKFVTKTDMDTAIADAVTGGTVDLSDYQLKEDNALETTDKTIVGAINELKKSGSGSGSGEGLTDEEKQQLSDAYKHSQSAHVSIKDIPTKVSELTNDSNFYVAPTTGKVCTTTVEDNTGTIMLTLPSNYTGVSNGAYVKYKIVDGWCITSFTVGVTAITTSVSNYVQCATGLPPSAGVYYYGLFSENGNTNTQVTVMFRTDGTMKILAKGSNVTAQDFYLGNFAYPVKES